MGKASDNIFPKLINSMNATDQSAPSDSSWKVYAKANGIFARSSNSVVGPFGTGGGGAVATDTIWDAAGDIAVGTGADTAVRLAMGAAGTVPTAGASTLAYGYPPGYEMAYVEKTTSTTITAGTVEATAVSIVSAGAVAFDGTAVLIECYIPSASSPNALDNLRLWLYDGGSSIGEIGQTTNPAVSGAGVASPAFLVRRMVPAAGSRTYSIRGSATTVASAAAGGGGAGALMPAFIRITKV